MLQDYSIKTPTKPVDIKPESSKVALPDTSAVHLYELVFDIAKIVYSSLDLETIVESVLSIAGNLVNAERCSLFLLDQKTNELYTLAFDVGSQSNIYDGPGSHNDKHVNRDESPGSTHGTLAPVGGIASHTLGTSKSGAIHDMDCLSSHSHAAISSKCSLDISSRQAPALQTTNSALIVEDIDSIERTRQLASEAFRHHKPNPGIRFPVGTGVAGYVAQTRQGLNIRDAYADPRFNPAVDKQTGFKTNSLLCLPIFGPIGEDGQPELVGVVMLVNKIGNPASPGTTNAESAFKPLLQTAAYSPPISPGSISIPVPEISIADESTRMSSTDPHYSNSNYSHDAPDLEGKAHAVFTDNDTHLMKNLLVLVGIAIKNAKQYQISKDAQMQAINIAKNNEELYKKTQHETDKGIMLIQLASTLYVEDNTKKLIQKIVGMAKQLIGADKASFFIVDHEKQQMHSSVFDNETECSFVVPLNKGIAGHVATSGNMINLQDVYADDRFNPEVDVKTHYHTHSMLSVPVVGPTGKVVAVVSMINKLVPGSTEPTVFTKSDEDMVSSFAVFCGLALHKTMLLEEIEKQRLRLALTMEMMSFHSMVHEDESLALRQAIPNKTISVTDLREYFFDPHGISHTDESLAAITYQMFLDLSYGSRYSLPDEKVINYVLTVRKNYRPVTYHNFTHAVSVTHAFYSLVVNGVLDGILDPIEQYAMFVACLNHDIDHRGTNNQFQKQAHTELANFYSTSTMERHHFNHTMTILNQGNGINILQHLNSEDYEKALKVIEHSILATDLGLFFASRGKITTLISEKKFNKDIVEHRELLRGVIMTCCDLSSMYKPWKAARVTADSVYEEFFLQGDEELRLGLRLSGELMDRNKTAEIPRMQVDFYNFVVIPAFDCLYGLLGDSVQIMREGVIDNRAKWKDLKDSGIPYKCGIDVGSNI
ncbi:hypothetical protein BSLG_000282 [Batrachochytrium salamandrivorans]|nr:hypothetical protein BSLG_000282 [Batrachochytrium salamandrivorans]